MASRRKSRELALQMLFQWDVGKHSPQHVVDTFLIPKQVDEESAKFARELFEGAAAAVELLDSSLSERSANWRVERMPAVDRCVLRLALYEIQRYPGTPAAVVINEALELARKFSSEESVEFVNGVLDAIHKSSAVRNAG